MSTNGDECTWARVRLDGSTEDCGGRIARLAEHGDRDGRPYCEAHGDARMYQLDHAYGEELDT